MAGIPDPMALVNTRTCRLCLDNRNIIEIQQLDSKTYSSEDFEIELVELFKVYEFLATSKVHSPILLCDSCVNELIASYEFMMKIHSAEDRFSTVQQVTDANVVSVPSRLEIEFPVDEVAKQNDSITTEELQPAEETVQSVPMEITEQTTVEQPKSAKKRSSPKKTPTTTGKYCIALPRFVFTQQSPNETMDDSGASSKRTKVLDVEAVEIKYGDLQDIPKDIDIVDSDNDSIETPIYACKYCPKAYSTQNHLILHTRKCHLCQYCLQGFVQIADLHAHNKEAHSEFDCYVCPAKKFYSSSSLRGHMKRNHGISLPVHVSLLSINILGA